MDYFQKNCPIGIRGLLTKMELKLFKSHKVHEKVSRDNDIGVEYAELRKGVLIWRISGTVDIEFDICCKKLASRQYFINFPNAPVSSKDQTHLYKFSTPKGKESKKISNRILNFSVFCFQAVKWSDQSFHAYLFR